MMDANKGDQTTQHVTNGTHASNGTDMSNGNGSMHEVYENIIVGGGPDGVNLAMEFAVRGMPYILLERSSTFGDEFNRYPVSGELISLNKKYIPVENKDWSYARRYDWHTLSTITENDSKADPKLVFTNWTDSLFPEAKLFAQYVDYVGNHPNWHVVDHTHFNCEVVHITKDDSNRFVVKTKDGKTLLSQRLYIATDKSRSIVPNIPGLAEHGTLYGDYNPKDKERYRNKTIVILGSGNSAFEVANSVRAIAGDTIILIRGVLKFARQTHNVHDVRTQLSLNYDLSQLKSLSIISAERLTEVTPKNGRLHMRLCSAEPHWKTPRWWPNREIMVDEIIVCCGFDYTLPDVFTSDRVQPQKDSTGKSCELTATWESVNVPNLYFLGGSMRVNDHDGASGFIQGFRYNIQTLGAYLAERYYNQPLKPIYQCVLDPKSDDTFEPLCKFITSMVSSAAALFELFNYGCCTITFQEIPRQDNSTTPTYKAEVWDVFPLDYVRQRWACKKTYVGRVEILFQYGFHLYGENTPTSYFTHSTDHFHPELSAYIHPVLHAFRHDSEDMDKFPGAPGKVEDWHMQENPLAQWNEDHYIDEYRNTHQYTNTVYNSVAAVLGMSNRKSTLPVLEEFIERAYPVMTPEEVKQAFKREPGLLCVVEGRKAMLKATAAPNTTCHLQKNEKKIMAQMEEKTAAITL